MLKFEHIPLKSERVLQELFVTQLLSMISELNKFVARTVQHNLRTAHFVYNFTPKNIA